jgi:hypothetical protein
MTVPSDLSVSGSPVTTTGTLAITANTQNANLIKAGPASGAAAAPTYRALTTADLPTSIPKYETTAYTLLLADINTCVALSGSSGATTFTIPQAGTTGFEAGKVFCVENLDAHNLTLTTTTSTFQGLATNPLTQNMWALLTSDGTNWLVSEASPTGGGGGFTGTWTSYTPTWTCTGGSLTLGAMLGRYVTNGKVTNIDIDITASATGTCSGLTSVSLPNTVTAAAGNIVVPCREVGSVGDMWVMTAGPSATTATLTRYDNIATVTTGFEMVCSGSYENN